MIIIGIDPGSRITGYGVIQKNKGQITHVDNGCLTTKSTETPPERLYRIYTGLMEVLKKFKPGAFVIEEVFFAKNVASSLRLGESRGIALLAAMQNRIPIFEYATREAKQAMTGYGQATKEQVQKMVQRILKLPEITQVDASDALALAICHANSVKLGRIVS